MYKVWQVEVEFNIDFFSDKKFILKIDFSYNLFFLWRFSFIKS